MSRTKRESKYAGQVSAVVDEKTLTALLAGAEASDRTVAAELRHVLKQYYNKK